MKIKPEELAKIVEEEAFKILEEVWMPGQTMDKIAGDLARLGPLKEPKAQQKLQQEPQQASEKPEEKPEEKPVIKTMSASDLEKNLKILMRPTRSIFLNTIKPLLKAFAPENFLSDIVKRARIDDTTIFKKQIINFIEKMETYSSVSLKEDLKQDLLRKRKLLANIDRVMSNVRDQISSKLSKKAEKDILGIKQDIIKYLEQNKTTINNMRILQKLKTEGSEEWLLKQLKQHIIAVSNCLVLITKQTILNAHAQKDIPG